MTEIPAFGNRNKLFEWLVENKNLLISEKKAQLKYADAYSFMQTSATNKELATKANGVGMDPMKLFVRSVINTTNIMDSHSDVHIKGLWKKSLSEQKENYLIEEHNFNFKGIISDDITAYTKRMTWKALGYDIDGDTEALVYDSILTKDRNPYMFEQYAKGRVKQHSVGMQYVKIYMCIDSPLYEEEKENWDKYIDEVTFNRAAAEAKGYFWAVTEAKNIEGSAVVRGSCIVTPTQIVREEKAEPVKSTPFNKSEPVKSTQIMNALSELSTKIKM